MDCATDVERMVNEWTDRGMEMLKMLRLEEANEAFDRVYDLKPDAYLWQSGIARFYLDDVHGAAERFAHNANLYESKFGGPASEERIWRDACELKVRSSMGKKGRRDVDDEEESDGAEGASARKPLTAEISERDGMAEMMCTENRKVIRIARDLFSASVSNDHSLVVLSRAKLRSICSEPTVRRRPDRKMWKMTSWYYLGLHYDAIGDSKESKTCMKMAMTLCPSAGNGIDIVHTLPVMHMSRRDWFDDDEFVEDDDATRKEGGSGGGAPSSRRDGAEGDAVGREDGKGGTGRVVSNSISDSVGKLRLAQLREALRARGLKSAGSKEELRARLFESLVEDAGLE